MIVNITIEDRLDGGVTVSSDELPGLILSGRDRTKIIASIEPAVRALLKHKGHEPTNLRIEATLVQNGVAP